MWCAAIDEMKPMKALERKDGLSWGLLYALNPTSFRVGIVAEVWGSINTDCIIKNVLMTSFPLS